MVPVDRTKKSLHRISVAAAVILQLSTYHNIPTHQNFASFPSPKVPIGTCVYCNREVELKLLRKCVACGCVLFW